MFYKKERSFWNKVRSWSIENRYLLFYFLWVAIAIFIIGFVDELLVIREYHCIPHLLALLLLIFICTPVYVIGHELSQLIRKRSNRFNYSLPFRFPKVTLFAFIYLLFSWSFLERFCYASIKFKHSKIYFNLPFLKINDFLLSKICLIYLDLIAILILGVLPILITARFTTRTQGIKKQSWQQVDTNLKTAGIAAWRYFQVKLSPFPYLKRLIPLMKTILQDKLNIIVIGTATNSSVIIFILVIIFSDVVTNTEVDYGFIILRGTFVTFTTWLSSLAAWLLPFLMGLTSHLEKTISHTYLRKLKHTIETLKDHIIIVGYGDLGKKAANEVRQITYGREKLTYILIPNTNLDFIPLRTDILVVDKDEKAFRFIDSSMPDIKIGIAEIVKDREGIFSPAIIGDINLPSTLELTNLSKAKMVLNVTKDENSTFSILEFTDMESNKERIPHLVLSFYKTADKSFLITRGINVGRYFIYPIQISGISIGNTLYSFYRKGSPCNNWKPEEKVLIIGSGKQLFFIIESFWIRIKEHFKTDRAVQDYFVRSINLMTESSAIKDKLSENYKWQLPVPRSIYQHSHLGESTVNNYLEVPIAGGSPLNLIDLENVIECFQPKYIVISFEESKKTMDVLHELLVIAHREGWIYGDIRNRDKPYLIVSTRDKANQYVKDVIFYWAKGITDEGYPKQYPDGIVDFYEGSKGMIRGLVESTINHEREKDQFELSICLNKIGGATTSILTKMAGLRVSNIKNSNKFIPSFMNFDTKNMNNDKWCFNSQVILVPSSDTSLRFHSSEFGRSYFLDDLCKALKSVLYFKTIDGLNQLLKDPHLCEKLINNTDKKLTEEFQLLKDAYHTSNTEDDLKRFNRRLLEEIYPKETPKHDNVIRALLVNAEKETRDKIKQILGLPIAVPQNLRELDMRPVLCPGRQVCSIYTYSRRFESDYRRYLRYEARLKSEPQNTELENKKKELCENLEKYTKTTISSPEAEESNILGEMIVCGCGKKPGSLASILNNLLFRTTESSYKEEIININYIQGFTCYNKKFTYHKIIGGITEFDHRGRNTSKSFLDACLIHPITCADKWKEYATELYRFLNDYSNEPYNLFFDKLDNPTRILLSKSTSLIYDDKNKRFIEKEKVLCKADKGDCKILDSCYRLTWMKI